jgi:hypothetical protein
LVLSVKYNSNNEIEGGEIGSTCSTHGEKRNAYRALMGKPEGNTTLGRLDLGGMIILKLLEK